MFDRYSDRARRAVALADQAASGLGHDTVDTGHLLIGLATEDGGVARVALDSLGVTVEAANEAVRRHRPAGNADPGAFRVFTSRLTKALELARRESLKLGNNFVGTEHLLLGLVADGEDVTGTALTEIAEVASPGAVRAKVLELLRGYARAEAVERATAALAGARSPRPADQQAFAWELVARMRKFLGHIEDMGDDERVFMLGALTGALERTLRDAGVPEPDGAQA